MRNLENRASAPLAWLPPPFFSLGPGATLPPAALFPWALTGLAGVWLIFVSLIVLESTEVTLLAKSLWVHFQAIAYTPSSDVTLL